MGKDSAGDEPGGPEAQGEGVPELMALSWSESAGRFVDSRGRFVSEAAVRSVIDQIADGGAARMAAASQAMLDGTLSLAEWQSLVMRTAKLGHVAAATIAHGGQAQMTFSRYGQVGAIVKSEYQFIRQFAEQIASGVQPLNGTIASRSQLYGQAVRATFSKLYGEGQQRRGFQSEQNTIRSGE